MYDTLFLKWRKLTLGDKHVQPVFVYICFSITSNISGCKDFWWGPEKGCLPCRCANGKKCNKWTGDCNGRCADLCSYPRNCLYVCKCMCMWVLKLVCGCGMWYNVDSSSDGLPLREQLWVINLNISLYHLVITVAMIEILWVQNWCRSIRPKRVEKGWPSLIRPRPKPIVESTTANSRFDQIIISAIIQPRNKWIFRESGPKST